MRTWGGGMLTMGETSGAHVDPPQPTALAQGVLDAWGLVNAAIASFEVSTKISVGPMRSGQYHKLYFVLSANRAIPMAKETIEIPKRCSQRAQSTL